MEPSNLHHINHCLPPVNITVAVRVEGEFIVGKRLTWLVSYKKELSVFEFTSSEGEVFNVPAKSVQWFYP